MWVALVVLIMMSIAGIAMLRQMGSGISVAGNVAFKQNATSSADVGVEAARAWFVAQPTAVLDADAAAQGYYSTWGPSVDPETFDWSAAGSVVVSAPGAGANDIAVGNTTRYVIHRLCQNTGSIQANNQVCSDLEDDQTRQRGSIDYSAPPLTPSFKPYFRVTTRTEGPRRTVSFTQVILN